MIPNLFARRESEFCRKDFFNGRLPRWLAQQDLPVSLNLTFPWHPWKKGVK